MVSLHWFSNLHLLVWWKGLQFGASRRLWSFRGFKKPPVILLTLGCYIPSHARFDEGSGGFPGFSKNALILVEFTGMDGLDLGCFLNLLGRFFAPILDAGSAECWRSYGAPCFSKLWKFGREEDISFMYIYIHVISTTYICMYKYWHMAFFFYYFDSVVRKWRERICRAVGITKILYSMW